MNNIIFYSFVCTLTAAVSPGSPSSDPTSNSPNQTSTGVSRVSVIVAAVVVTALVVILMAAFAIITIVLRHKKGTKQGISNQACGKTV